MTLIAFQIKYFSNQILENKASIMVLTRSSKKKRGKNNNPTSETETSTIHTRTQQNETIGTLANLGAEDEKIMEDQKLVASLVHWSGTDRDMGKIFYDKFASALEQEVQSFEENKHNLKECIRKNLGNLKVFFHI